MTSQRPQPRSPSELFFAFTLLALQGFGGVLAVVQHELVERKGWLSREEFLEEWAVAQIMPGPNVVNLTLALGARYFGLAGAMASLAGLITLPLCLVLVLGAAYVEYGSHPHVAGALRGMGAVAAGLIIAAGMKLFGALRSNVLGLPLCIALSVATFAGAALLHWPLVYILLALGGVGCLVAYRKLAP